VKGGKIERHLHSLTPEEKNTSEFDLRADFFDKSTVFFIVSHTENALVGSSPGFYTLLLLPS
jgi:hypothetical protein